MVLLGRMAAHEQYRAGAVAQHEAGGMPDRMRSRRLVPPVDAYANHHKRACALPGHSRDDPPRLALGWDRLRTSAQRSRGLGRFLQRCFRGVTLGLANGAQPVRPSERT